MDGQSSLHELLVKGDYFGELLSLLLGALGGESLFELLQAAHAAVGKHLRLFLFVAVVLACGV